MGYYTEFELTVSCNGRYSPASIIREMDKYSIYSQAFGNLFEYRKNADSETEMFLISYGQIKWYEATHDIMELSKIFPKAEFILHGEGEDNFDIWETKICEGRVIGERRIEHQWSEWI